MTTGSPAIDQDEVTADATSTRRRRLLARWKAGAAPIETVLARQTPPAVATIALLVLWFLVIVLGRVWGLLLEAQRVAITLYVPPILGAIRQDFGPRFLIPVGVGLAGAFALPRLIARFRWRAAVALATGSTLLWWVVLARIDPDGGLTRGLEWWMFEAAAADVSRDPLGYLRGFTDALPTYSVQVRGHPPGLPLMLGGLDRLGLPGPGWAATFILAIAISGIPAVLITIRRVASEHAARMAMPFLVLAPSAAWFATSYDAMFAAIGAWFILCLVLATESAGKRRVALCVGAGALATLLILFSYGMGLMGAVAVVIVIARRAWFIVLLTAAASLAFTAALVPLGFWWISGLQATIHEYHTLDVVRPYNYFVFNNVAAWFLAIGPATLVGLTRLRDRKLWLLVGGGLLAVVTANLSGLSQGEVERIWLPFTLWVLPAGAALSGRGRATTGWLALQVVSSVGLAVVVTTYW